MQSFKLVTKDRKHPPTKALPVEFQAKGLRAKLSQQVKEWKQLKCVESTSSFLELIIIAWSIPEERSTSSSDSQQAHSELEQHNHKSGISSSTPLHPSTKLRNNHFSEGKNITRTVNTPVWWFLGQEAHSRLETSNLNSPSGLAAPEQHRQGSMDNLECVPPSCHHEGQLELPWGEWKSRALKLLGEGYNSQKNKG